jgi:MoxR-like ATPase
MKLPIADIQETYQIAGRGDELTSALISAAAGKHILIEGPVGVGKTTIALAVASHFQREFERIDGDERYTEQKLTGWFDPPLVMSKGYSEESFIQGPLSVAMISGEILLLNELNRMPEGAQNVLLSAMDEKTISIPRYGRIHAKDGFMIIATENPDEYIGTSQLSEALKDRFVCIDLDYQSEAEEKEIVRLRSRCEDEDIVDTSVIFCRLTRTDEDVRRGASIRGAIDLSDIFYSANGRFTGDVDDWIRCAKLAFQTKIELHDFSHSGFMELMKRLAQRAISEQKARAAAPKSIQRDSPSSHPTTPASAEATAKKKSKTIPTGS